MLSYIKLNLNDGNIDMFALFTNIILINRS